MIPSDTKEISPPEGPGPLDLDAELVENVSDLVAAGEEAAVRNFVVDLHGADLALLLTHLSFEHARRLFKWLPVEPAGEVLAELDDDYRAELLEEADRHRLTAMLDELDSDDAADVLADLPEHVAREVLPKLEDAEDVEELLAHDEETAGGLMAAEFIAVPSDCSVAEATEVVRGKAESVENVYVVYTTDPEDRLQGVVSLKRLLLSPSGSRLSEVMMTDVISVPTGMDQEEVARIMERYDLVSLPVVDDALHIVGRITIDDVVSVIREEAEEDIQRMSGVAGGEEPTDSVARIIAGRLPWLLVGLVGAGLAALAIGSFDSAIKQATVLAAFIPIVMATAGNAGIQSSAIAVQGLASGEVWTSDMFKRLSKELVVAVSNGLITALVLGAGILLLAQFFPALAHPVQLALTAGIALLIVIVIATSIGASVPLILHRLKIDPALATGPFITTSNDILGILVFFLLAKWLYL